MRKRVVRLAGVEPATLGLEVRCSIQLSYRRVRHLRYTNDALTNGGLVTGQSCGSVRNQPLYSLMETIGRKVRVLLLGVQAAVMYASGHANGCRSSPDVRATVTWVVGQDTDARGSTRIGVIVFFVSQHRTNTNQEL